MILTAVLLFLIIAAQWFFVIPLLNDLDRRLQRLERGQ